MRIPGRKGILRVARLLRSRLVRGALILGYHSVACPADDPYGLCVPPRHFAEHIEVLRRYAEPMALQELMRAIQTGVVPRRAVVVTFDDGYLDNLRSARPILERYQVPATVFMVAGSLGREFWWDELARLVNAADGSERGRSLEIGEAVVDITPDLFMPGKRKQLRDELYRRLWPLSEEGRQHGLDQIRSWGDSMAPAETAQRALTATELLQLAEGGLIDVGSHTVTHSPLATLALDAQRCEMRRSKAMLEEVVGRPILSFSYPHGSLGRDSRHLVRDAGYTCGCGSTNDVAWRGSEPFNLPRVWVPDVDGDRFLRWLRRWDYAWMVQ